MRGNSCPSSKELTRRFGDKADAHISEHLQQCGKCAREWASFEHIQRLGKELPDGQPSVNRAESVRSSLLMRACELKVDKRSPYLSGRLYGAVAASIVLSVGVYVLLNSAERLRKGAEENKIHRAVVYSHGDSTYEVVDAQPNEIVRLSQGTITVQVESLEVGERFRVVTGDAEVEVRGTAFNVTAKDDRLIAVSVSIGKVEVRPSGLATIVLKAKERWTRPSSDIPETRKESGMEETAIAEELTNRISIMEAPAVHNQRERGSQSVSRRRTAEKRQDLEPEESEPQTSDHAVEPGPAEIAFNNGWEALRSGAPRQAADWFGRSIAAAGANRIAEDASFWMAVAYGRAGAQEQAIDALMAFLASYPGSLRSGEASAMLGWKLFDSGDLEGAWKSFSDALGDPSPRIRKSAEKGLKDIEDRRQKKAE